ncbi:UpxY family transcription antiterminator [Mangrovibacterium diazotrophicum]|uniref:Transcription antitermination factor NusG n=1 Tax=Mangrovibacterium diazotrophicum TaxID=1261403 RepID=A0A419VVK4_9BACT|nr:UpxY family transcription antiterminator [Mangrovibacterium diazotrophicum]RKD86200.1 transcription antitermination factor NusG [Mangrovibacterium diazotrophicum]
MSLINSNYQWFALYTKSRFEKKVHASLQSKGIESYLPIRTEKRRWSDRIKTIEEPLLKGYIFVKVSNKEYFNVLNTTGAVAYVSFGGKAAPIPEKQLDDLKIFLQGYNQEIDVTYDNLEEGLKVIVVAGPMKGVVGEVVEFRGKSRIALRFKNLGYCILTDIATKDVEAYKPHLISSHKRLVNSLLSA